MDSVSKKAKRGQRGSSAVLPPRRRKSARLVTAAVAQGAQEQRDAAAAESWKPGLPYKEADTDTTAGCGGKKAKAESIEVKIEPLIMPYKEAHTYVPAGGGDKKANAEPTAEDMKPILIPILKRLNLASSASLTHLITEKLGAHFGCDLKHRHKEIFNLALDIIDSTPPSVLW